ncbi:uncharacterized protein LY79DRAFT_278619 [Colletotrichum navitas]|uniref:Uncharacterized protein n=1 Tax=Colletotrichum navitas TaxID=681940 RepID=A0AAD8PVP5_9PEZI|nr:uncharacterized protein LY79DRAFT_278619 [Colletotrichum navitas]KAK1585088.1 hypothetical protein LY79DRAFT_278619 [Colletotrichum navitas]
MAHGMYVSLPRPPSPRSSQLLGTLLRTHVPLIGYFPAGKETKTRTPYFGRHDRGQPPLSSRHFWSYVTWKPTSFFPRLGFLWPSTLISSHAGGRLAFGLVYLIAGLGIVTRPDIKRCARNIVTLPRPYMVYPKHGFLSSLTCCLPVSNARPASTCRYDQTDPALGLCERRRPLASSSHPPCRRLSPRPAFP